MKLFELRRERAQKLEQARNIVQASIDAARDLTDDEKAQVTNLRSAAEDLSRKIELFELRDDLAGDLESRDAGGRLGPGSGRDNGQPDLPDLDGRTPYSLLRALRMVYEIRHGKTGARLDGIEGEVHAELLRHKPDGVAQGVLVPWSLANPRSAERMGLSPRAEFRGDVTTTAAAGSIANILGTPLIQYLRNRMVMQRMGAILLTGLEGGTFSLPKQTGTETAYHVGESSAPTNSNLTLGQVTWTPRTLAARSLITRKTLVQSSLDVEMLVRGSLVQTLGREFDRVGVNGSGQNQVPLGIMQDPNVPTVAINTNGGAPTWAMVVNLEKLVAQANADFGSLGYITSNAGRSKMKQTTKISASQYSSWLWENDALGVGEVNGYRAMATEQVPSNLAKGSGTNLTSLIFGNFESATYGLWSGLDVLVDPYTAASSGGLVINVFQDYDFQMRYEVGFAKCVDIDPS